MTHTMTHTRTHIDINYFVRFSQQIVIIVYHLIGSLGKKSSVIFCVLPILCSSYYSFEENNIILFVNHEL